MFLPVLSVPIRLPPIYGGSYILERNYFDPTRENESKWGDTRGVKNCPVSSDGDLALNIYCAF